MTSQNRCGRIASLALTTIGVRAAVRALLCLGVIVLVGAVSGCDFVYLPECDSDCTAGGGNDSYGRANP